MASKFLEQMAAEDRARKRNQAVSDIPSAKSIEEETLMKSGIGAANAAAPTVSGQRADISSIAADFRKRLETGRRKPPTPEKKTNSIPGLSLPELPATAEETKKGFTLLPMNAAQEFGSILDNPESTAKALTAKWGERKREQAQQRGGPMQRITDFLSPYADILSPYTYSGDSSLPMNAATQEIGAIRNNPEDVKKALEEQEELEAKKQEKAARTAAWAKEHPFLASTGSLLTSPLSSTDYLQRMIEMTAIGQTIPGENLMPGEVTQTLRSGASEDMGTVGKFLYNTGMSALDSWNAASLGGGVPGVGGAILAMGAASATANDIRDRGGTDEQALIGGAVSGIFESLFETLSISQLDALKEAPVDSVKTLLKNLAKNTLTNASEEAATELANTIFDSLYMKELSNYTENVKTAMAAGMSEQEARAYAMKAAAAEIGMSALSGGLMGVGMGAAGSAMGALGSGQLQSEWLSKQTDKAQNSAYQTMSEKGLFSPEASKAAQDAVARMDQARRRSGLDVPSWALEWNGSQDSALSAAETGAEGQERAGEAQSPQVTQEGLETAENAAQEPSVSTPSKTAGLEARSAAFSKEDRQLLNRLGKITGANIQVVSQAELARITGREGANGVQIGSQIYLSEDADRPLLEVAKHELTHRLQDAAPDAYGAFRDYVAGVYRESGTLESYIDGLRRSREGVGIQLTEEQALDEIAADYAGSLMVDENAARRLAGENRGLLERMLDGLRDFIRKIKSALGGNRDGGQVQELEEAARLWQNALEESGRNVKKLELPTLDNRDVSKDGQSPSARLRRSRARTDSDTSTNPFSMQGDAELKKTIERLKRQNERLREQTKRTVRAEMNRSNIEKQARDVLKEYGSQYDKQALSDRLDTLYRGIANQTISETDMRQEARSIAEDILSESQGQTNELYEQYLELRKELRTQGISIAPEYRADLESAGGYEDLRKRYFGKLRLGNNGTAVDQVYDDLASRYPELFPDDIFHPADQLLRIIDVADELGPVMGNPYEQGMDRTVEYLAGDLLERYYDFATAISNGRAKFNRARPLDGAVSTIVDTPEKAPTFADKQARKMAEQRAEDRAKMLEAVAKERTKKETALREMRERYREADRKRIDRQNASQRRETIRRHANRLGRMLLRPTDKQHIPEGLRGAALELVRQIDTGSNYFLDPDTGKRVYTRDGNSIDTADPAQIQTRRTMAARALQKQYEALAENRDFTIDPDMDGYLDELIDMGGTPLGDMSKSQLDTVWKVMRVIEHCITRSNELLGQSRYATVSEMAERIREDTDTLRRRSQWAGIIGKTDGLLNLDMLTPETYFHKLGEAGDDFFQQTRRAQDKQITIQGDILEKFQEAYEQSGQKAWKLEHETHSFDTSGGKVTLTTAQIMELYTLSKREQAQGHLYTGGIRPEAVRGKWMKMEGGGRAVTITPADAAQITGTLTAEQKALADRMQDILSNDLSAYGNEASMEVYGYEKFKEKNYWPIKIGSQDSRTDPAAKASSKTIPGYGMTKAVQPDARNPVVLHSAFDTFAQHVAEMSTYAGWLGTNENATRLLNYQFRDAEGNQDGTMKDRLEHIHGAGGTKYLEKLLGDIAQGTKAKSDTVFSTGGLTSAFKSSAISANLRVAMQQPTAVFRAMEMVDPKYFVTGLGQKELTKGWETAKKYAPIAKWKDWGYFEMDTGQSYKDLMLGSKNVLGKFQGWLMSPAGWADSVGWGYLWKVVEAETADKHKGLKKGSAEFYQAAAERFGEIIDRTQVVDSVLHRTQMMRSETSLHKMASSFMSEPSKQYNEIARNIYDLTRAKGKKDGEGMRKAMGHLIRTAAAMSLSFAVNALAQSAPDTWRDDDRDKSNREKFQENWWENFRENYNPTGYIPYVKDLWSIVDSVILKKNAFGGDVSRMDMEVVEDIVKAAGQAVEVYYGNGKKTKANAYLDAAFQLGRLAGLPLTTIKKDAIGIAGWFMQATGNNEALYQMDKLLYEEGNDAKRFTGHLYRAMNTDWEQYGNIYEDILKNWEQYGGGKENWDEDKFQEKIKNSMEGHMAKDMGLKKVSSLPVEYTPPGLRRSFDQEVMRQLTKGGTWMDTLPEGTLEQAKELDTLKPEDGADSVTKMQKIRELRDSIWGDDVKDLFLSKILGEKDYERLKGARKAGISIEKWCKLYEDISKEKVRRTGQAGSPSQADVTAALKKSGLTEKQKDVIWAGYGWKGERE